MGWPIKRLGNVCDLQNGYAFRSKDYVDHSSTLNIRMSNIRPDGSFNPDHNIRFLPDTYVEDYSSFLLKEGDLVIAMTDMAGDPKILGLPTLVKNLKGRNFLLNQRVGKFFDFSEHIYIPYLRYYLSSPIIKEYYKRKGAGGLQINISKKDVLSVKIPLPPIPEQKRIVAILDQTFADIEQARARTEQNLKNARELFESYLQRAFSLQGDRWDYKKLEDLSDLITKGSSPKWQGISYVETPGVLFVTSENVGANQMIYKKTKFVEEAFNKKDSKSILKKGDVLTNIVGASIGRTAIYDRNDIANINQAVCLIRCKLKILHNEYLAYLLNSPYLVKVLHDNEIDNARANLSLTFFRKLAVPIPPLSEQELLINEINLFHGKSKKLECIYRKKLESLNELKKTILQKAFTGEFTTEESKGAAA